MATRRSSRTPKPTEKVRQESEGALLAQIAPSSEEQPTTRPEPQRRPTPPTPARKRPYEVAFDIRSAPVVLGRHSPLHLPTYASLYAHLRAWALAPLTSFLPAPRCIDSWGRDAAEERDTWLCVGPRARAPKPRSDRVALESAISGTGDDYEHEDLLRELVGHARDVRQRSRDEYRKTLMRMKSKGIYAQ